MEYTNTKGVKYYLHTRKNILPRNKAEVTTYFFRKEKKEDYCDKLPLRLTVSETPTGLPVVKRI